jgi:hypothetical protein
MSSPILPAPVVTIPRERWSGFVRRIVKEAGECVDPRPAVQTGATMTGGAGANPRDRR